MASVGVRELKAHLSQFIERASGGEAVIVTEHGRPVAVLAPLPAGMRVMERLRRGGEIHWTGGKPAIVAVELAENADVSAAVIEARSR